MTNILERLRLREMDGTATLGDLSAIDEIERLRSALKLAAGYWSDYHVPCVYEEWDNDCDLCPVIGAVRAALGEQA